MGLWLAPRAFSSIMVTFLEAVKPMQAQVEMGREGGIVFIPWHITDKGRALAQIQLAGCSHFADIIRTEHEKEMTNAEAV